MSEGVHDTGPAPYVTPYQVPREDEEKARALFLQWRYADNGGVPYCPRCKSEVLYRYRCRDEFKCKECQKRFSPTSDSRWRYAKLDYGKLMYMAAEFCHAPDALSANSLRQDIEVHYKTAFLWLHKFRQEVADFMAGAKLGNEVEVDGGHYGGKVRPKNVKKERTDLRRSKYSDPRRQMAVTFAVERGGAVRAWVSHHEGHPRERIEEAMTADAVVFTDSAYHWHAFRGSRKHFQVNHNESFMNPEACTNAAESVIGALRVSEDIHRHITSNYLDLYAAETGWRRTHHKTRRRERLETLMGRMAMPGRSPLAGYFEGNKRRCRIIDEAGEVALWSPPTRAERDKSRIARGKQPFEGPYRPQRTLQNWHEGFEMLAAKDLAQGAPDAVPDRPGVYLICLPTGSPQLDKWGLDPTAKLPIWRTGNLDHIYTGETYGLRSRIREHLMGTVERSTFRETLLTLWWLERPHDLGHLENRAQAENAITEWLLANAAVAYKRSAYVRDYERDVLSFVASPFNMRRDNPTDFTRWLQAQRKRFRGAVMSRWAPAESATPPRRRH